MLQKGSEWRRWDLHVHTPGTVLNDQFGDWEEFLTRVEADPDVKVIGVTDYMSIANYARLKTEKENGRIPNINLLIPNIEFRIAPPTDKATAVNIHLLISPVDPNHEKEILNALARLQWAYDRRNYSCLPDQLMALGRAIDPTIQDDKNALEVGTTQFKVDFTTLRDWYNSEPWIKQHGLVAVSAGVDGLSGFRRDGAWMALRDEITRFSQILFSARPAERDFWLGQGSEEDRETVKRLGGIKPCVHGSDAHEIAKLFRPDQDRFCWIKADPTFEGLRQILYEPKDRVHIGPTPPVYHDEARVMRALKISNSNGWFDDITVPLNSGLVSIIGQKGTGKSALAELISYAAGSWHTDETDSFLRRAGQLLDGLSLQLIWADDSVMEIDLWEAQPDVQEVRYLSQKFVERLCADDHIGSELVAEIETVIFSYLDPSDTLNASSFEELRALRTEGIKEESRRLRQDIVRLIREECALRLAASKLTEKKERIKALGKEREGLAKQIPKAATPEEARLQKELQTRRTELTKLQHASADGKQKLQKLRDIRSRVVAFKAQITRFSVEIENALSEVGVPPADRAAFQPEFPADTDIPLTRRQSTIELEIRTREGATENPLAGTIRWTEAQIAALAIQESADKARQEKIKTSQNRISAIATEIARIEGETKKIEGPDHERLKAAAQERLEAYIAYFGNLKNEQVTLEDLYAPVKKQLTSGTAAAQEQELEFSIRWEADVSQWLERGSALFDQRKAIPYGTMDGLSKAASSILKPAWASGDLVLIRSAFDNFLAEFRKVPPSLYLRSGVTLEDVLLWLYEIDHIRLSYGLKYNGVELEKLSPGTKGIVLLILYLGIDTNDTRPLIVDQPDENLDNESIYALLTAYFKAAKARRQIILITHNPNLVVNSDSEQIIVATAERRGDGLPHITYTSGALEHTSADGTGIREQVCRILEGGTDAFRKRERRYALTAG
jgi:ABC-type Mn2+/Zn2+ transport system ATPase subunit